MWNPSGHLSAVALTAPIDSNEELRIYYKPLIDWAKSRGAEDLKDFYTKT
jgi:hypothetical protein